MKTCLIVNHRAGPGDRLSDVVDRFAGRTDCRILDTTASRDLRAAVSVAREDGVDRIMVAGGDGTLSRVVNAMAPDFSSFELAILPCGTGNDFARSLGIPLDSLDAAAEIALTGSAQAVDVLKMQNGSESYCVNAASGGFGGKIASDVDRHDKARWGAFAYWMTAVSKLLDLCPYRVSLQLDDQTHRDLELYGLAIANGRYVGGGFPIAPTADVTDGFLDVTAVPVLPTMELMAVGLNFTLGRQHDSVQLRTFRSRRVSVRAEPDIPFSIDGEPLTTVEAAFEVVPHSLRVVTGRSIATC